MQKINFNLNWNFEFTDGAIQYPARKVNLPHDWSLEAGRSPQSRMLEKGGFFLGGDGIYQKTLYAPEEWKEKKVYLSVEGAYMNAEVFIGADLIATHHYGYTSFIVDLSDHLTYGENNAVKIKVHNNALPNSRWYSGSGLFRPVEIWVADVSHIDPWGVFVKTKMQEDGSADVAITTELTSAEGTLLHTVITNEKGKTVGEITEALSEGTQTIKQHINIADPRLWELGDGYLYTLTSSILKDEEVLDTYRTAFGVRELALDTEKGFLLNGKVVKLKGGCVHHDCGILGSAAYEDGERRKVMALKNAGFNFIRCAHNPPSVAFLEVCDRVGMLVMDEAFDCWQLAKTPYDYHLYFDAHWQEDLTSMVKRDRNHPCIAFWSTGNEIADRLGLADGYANSKRLSAAIRALDDTRFITNALCNNWEDTSRDWTATAEIFAEPLDVMGYNYLCERYEDDLERYPERIILGCESYAAQAWENWQLVMKHPRVIGDCVWTGMDYIGEAGIGHSYLPGGDGRTHSLPYPWLLANCGDIDICGRARPQSYYRQILWGHRQKPYLAVHRPNKQGLKEQYNLWGWWDVANSWSWPGLESCKCYVDVYTDAEEVELYLNDELIGKAEVGAELPMMACFTCEYIPGTLKAVAYKGGKAVGEDVIATCGAPYAIELEADVTEIPSAYGRLSYIWAKVVDAQGNIVPYADNELMFSCVGAGKLFAVGSNDPLSEESYTGNTHKAYEGYALAAVMAQGIHGLTRLQVMAEGLLPARIDIKMLKERA